MPRTEAERRERAWKKVDALFEVRDAMTLDGVEDEADEAMFELTGDEWKAIDMSGLPTDVAEITHISHDYSKDNAMFEVGFTRPSGDAIRYIYADFAAALNDARTMFSAYAWTLYRRHSQGEVMLACSKGT